MTLGADPKKLKWLGVLGVVLVVALWYSNSSSESDHPSSPTRRTVPAAGADGVIPTGASGGGGTVITRRRGNSRNIPGQDVRPKFLGPNDAPIHPESIDPTIRFDLIAKVQSVPAGEGKRNVFAFGEVAPPPEPVKPGPRVPPILPGIKPPGTNPTIVRNDPPPPPPPPPIPLKFYGFSSRTAAKRAFFLDGEDILVGTEGEVLKGRYKIVRIGINSVVMEDQQFHHQQTLPLLEDQQS